MRSADTASSACCTSDPQRIERAHVGVELRLAGDDGRAQLRDAPPRRLELGRERGRPGLELGRRFLEALHFGGEAGGALDQRGVRGARLGGAPAQILGRFARLEQAPLRQRSGARRPARCSSCEADDRRARFVLTAIERVALLFGLTPLARELLALLRETRRLVGRVLQLRLEADDGLFLLVVFGVQRGDGVRGRSRSSPSSAAVSSASRDSASRSTSNPLAQLLDLALRLENAARVVAAAAGDELRPAEDGAVHGHDRHGVVRRLAAWRAVVRIGDPRVADRARMAPANGPFTRTIDDSATRPSEQSG